MKTSQKVDVIEVVYWECANPKHRHLLTACPVKAKEHQAATKDEQHGQAKTSRVLRSSAYSGSG